jgi:hypothetical protein
MPFLFCARKLKVSMHCFPQAVRLGAAIAPGVIMTPISSLLEACNAGHMNPESLMTRWTRGLIPRTVREVIFGIGLNQLSDYCEGASGSGLAPAMDKQL